LKLEFNRQAGNNPRMKFYAAIIAYLLIGLVLGWGILQVVHGHFWFLAVGIVVYVIAFAKIGCLPSGKSH
jgi:hypothetical protein